MSGLRQNSTMALFGRKIDVIVLLCVPLAGNVAVTSE